MPPAHEGKNLLIKHSRTFLNVLLKHSFLLFPTQVSKNITVGASPAKGRVQQPGSPPTNSCPLRFFPTAASSSVSQRWARHHHHQPTAASSQQSRHCQGVQGPGKQLSPLSAQPQGLNTTQTQVSVTDRKPILPKQPQAS